jgi:hypothetical protein
VVNRVDHLPKMCITCRARRRRGTLRATTGGRTLKKFESLELSVETLRDLTDDQLSQVAGGAITKDGCTLFTQTQMCPSGATWFAPCDYDDA